MEYRLGKCSSCGAEYKIPASFAHDVARCKVCKGTVRLEPARSGAPAAKPAAAERPAPRRAPEPKPEPRPPARVSDAPPAGVPREAPAPRPTPRREEAPPKPAERPRRVAAASTKKPFPRGALIGLLALIGIGAAAYFVFSDKEGTTTSVPPPAAGDDDAGSRAPQPPATGDAGEAAPKEEAAPDLAGSAPAPAIDLATFPDFGPAPETSAERWDELQRTASTFFDLDAGPEGTRAGLALEEAGRPAVPAILNQMKRIDLSTPEGMLQGGMAQKALERIAHGRGFGWKDEGTEGAAEYDRGVIEKWIATWMECSEDVEAWIQFTNLAEENPEEAARLRSEVENAAADDGG